MKIVLKIIALCWFCAAQIEAAAEMNPAEGRAIAECLQRFGGITPDLAERLHRYKQWSDTYEEIPCFTNCYLSKMFDIYHESKGFQHDNVIRKFGQPLYDACKERLMVQDTKDTCELAYKGFHCLVSLENDPFVYIESIQKIDSESKSAMRECLHRFDQYEWQRLPEFSKFPVREPIPCYTKCIADRLQLFSERTKQWNLDVMTKKLGFPSDVSKVENCKTLGRRRVRNACAWMYREITCYALSK